MSGSYILVERINKNKPGGFPELSFVGPLHSCGRLGPWCQSGTATRMNWRKETMVAKAGIGLMPPSADVDNPKTYRTQILQLPHRLYTCLISNRKLCRDPNQHLQQLKNCLTRTLDLRCRHTQKPLCNSSRPLTFSDSRPWQGSSAESTKICVARVSLRGARQGETQKLGA